MPTYRTYGLWTVISSLGDQSNEKGKILCKGVMRKVLSIFHWMSGWEFVFSIVCFLCSLDWRIIDTRLVKTVIFGRGLNFVLESVV